MQQPTGIGAAVNINGTGTEKTRGQKGQTKSHFQKLLKKVFLVPFKRKEQRYMLLESLQKRLFVCPFCPRFFKTVLSVCFYLSLMLLLSAVL
ncbi:hypothetical protein D7Y25_23010 [Parabacteroides goldsteinii]|nr:hypothetical protein [Parabacteroides goldsteinii]RLT82757.1 hypothetical protein D7Y25_23010 [Parabacteroides goldsteinii]